MIVLMISKDAKVLNSQSRVFLRMEDYSQMFEELHIFYLGSGFVKTPGIESKKLKVYNTSSVVQIISFLKVFVKLIRLGKGFKNNDLWITSQDPFETGFLALIASKLIKAKLQLQIHTDFLHPLFLKESFFNKFRVYIARIILPRAQSIRVVSENIKESLIKDSSFKVDKIKITVLPVLIDQDKILKEPIHLNLRDKFPDKFIVLMVCRLEIEKNIKLAIRSFAKFLLKKPNAILVIAGDGSQRQILEKVINENNLYEHVSFLGFIEGVYSLYKTTDVLLVTSDYEGYGMNMVEARVCNCPVVSTDAGIAKEVGATIVSRDEESIVNALSNIKRDQKPLQLISSLDYRKLFKDSFQ